MTNRLFSLSILLGVLNFLYTSPVYESNALKHRGHSHSQKALLNCDDTINGIGIDWDGEDTEINKKFYECDYDANQEEREEYVTTSIQEPFIEELCIEKVPIGFHVCLDKPIIYNSTIPLGGPHRPVWVTYGEYIYMPPQRWLHAIEHGAAVFLYNPCASPREIGYLKFLARNCLMKHVISPHNYLPNDENYNIITFGCKLALNKVKGFENRIFNFLKKHANKDGPESHVSEDGDYKFGLIQKAKYLAGSTCEAFLN